MYVTWLIHRAFTKSSEAKLCRDFWTTCCRQKAGAAGSDEAGSAASDSSSDSEDELNVDEYYFLQPVPTRQRRVLLRQSGASHRHQQGGGGGEVKCRGLSVETSQSRLVQQPAWRTQDTNESYCRSFNFPTLCASLLILSKITTTTPHVCRHQEDRGSGEGGMSRHPHVARDVRLRLSCLLRPGDLLLQRRRHQVSGTRVLVR